MLYWIFFTVFLLPKQCLSQLSKDKDELLNWCLDAKHHKSKPGKESSLFKQCIPWANHSCCTESTTVNLHTTTMYNFSYDHCSDAVGQRMSENCRKHFIQDLCFYECEPNIGYWVVETKRRIAKERFKYVPLCSSDCESWWNACKNDYTCAYNWPLDFSFSNGYNICKNEAKCLPFNEMYANASDFCENVWDHSWKVVSDKDPCMRIWFNGARGNPNRQVAEYFVNTQCSICTSSSNTQNFFQVWWTVAVSSVHILLALKMAEV